MTETFDGWLSLCDLALSACPKCGEFPAVYAIRNAATKDVLKYGCTNDLRHRIFVNFLGGVGGGTTQRIHGLLFRNGMISQVEIAWIEADNAAEAKVKETRFRQIYRKKYGRRPAWDLID